MSAVAQVQRGEVANAAIRNACLAYIEAGGTWSELARRCGWVCRNGVQADITRLKRRIGLVPLSGGRGRWIGRTTGMRYDIAVLIVEALGLDPIDFDL